MSSEEKRQELMMALDKVLYDIYQNYTTPSQRAALLADCVISEGWQWHPKPTREEWRRIPGWPNYEMLKTGEIRNYYTHGVPENISPYPNGLLYVLQVDKGVERLRSGQELLRQTWPTKLTEDIEPTIDYDIDNNCYRVDTGHAYVGPFETREIAQAAIDRMKQDEERHDHNN